MKRLLTYREQVLLRETEAWNRQQARRRQIFWIGFFAIMLAAIWIVGPECGRELC